MMKGYYNNERATNEIIKVGLDGKDGLKQEI